MATLEYWLQLENRPWDACPHNIDAGRRGQTFLIITQSTVLRAAAACRVWCISTERAVP